jgi:hypothetical protein
MALMFGTSIVRLEITRAGIPFGPIKVKVVASTSELLATTKPVGLFTVVPSA